MSSGGRFIVVEGIDGSGTSTQSRAIAAALEARGRTVILTHEPTNLEIGSVIRELLGGRVPLPDDGASERRLFALLFAADRLDHLKRPDSGIEAALARDVDVVCARYVLSSLAYEGDELELVDFVRGLNEAYRIPELTVYLDCPVDVALERISRTRASTDVFENREKLESVRRAYEAHLDVWPGRVLRIDARLLAHEITGAVLRELTPSE